MVLFALPELPRRGERGRTRPDFNRPHTRSAGGVISAGFPRFRRYCGRAELGRLLRVRRLEFAQRRAGYISRQPVCTVLQKRVAYSVAVIDPAGSSRRALCPAAPFHRLLEPTRMTHAGGQQRFLRRPWRNTRPRAVTAYLDLRQRKPTIFRKPTGGVSK